MLFRKTPVKRRCRLCSVAIAIVLALSTLLVTTAFTSFHPCRSSSRRRNREDTTTALRQPWRRLCTRLSGGGGDSNEWYRQMPSTPRNDGSWQLLNSFEHFLNQCAIQSLLFLINSLKDRHTALWLEDFTRPIIHSRTKETNGRDQVLTNMATALNDAMVHETQMERPIRLLTYHGVGAINTTLFPTWDAYFQKLLQEPTVEYSIESSRPHVPSYTLDIVPASLCSRIVSVREQIAREFVNDLDVLAETSLTAMERYRSKSNNDNQNNNDHNKLERIHQYFLEMSVHEDYAPSPLRKGNFDLLLSMTTQEAIHRILNRYYAAGDSREECAVGDDSTSTAAAAADAASVQFLRNFYAQRIGTHFTGSNFYGRADDFLDELLQTLPSVVQLQDSECGLVDPERLVEMIFKEREKVASEWIEISLDVPKSHTAIKRWQLNKLMGIDDNPPAVGQPASSFE